MQNRSLKTLHLLLGLVLLSSCSKVTVASLSSDNFQIQRGSPVVFENDTLRLTYNFWNKYGGGLMSFSIYNKLDEPIYIDWKNSAYIPNDRMMSYWQDETNTVGTASSSGYFYRGVGISSASVSSKAVHQERIAVIPPKSMISKYDYTLVPSESGLSLNNGKKTSIAYANDPAKTIKVKASSFTENTSPLRFRNYLTYSMNEKMEGKVNRINNSFYVSDLWEGTEISGILFSFKSNNAFFIR